MIMRDNDGIAIVGMDCRYPGSHNIKQLWDNILNVRQQFRKIPEDRLDLNYYYHPDRSANDYTYSTMAAVIDGYHFDRIKYKISKSTFEQTDMTHWMALDVANGALMDAGIDLGNKALKERFGVIIGNSLTGEFTRANVLRLRWPYMSRVLSSTLKEFDYDDQKIQNILRETEIKFKAPFPVPDADMLAGGLSNTIAGRICNYYDFKGGGYSIDGACSSSLLAVANACDALNNQRLDMVLAGGVDLSIDAFELIGFARNGALATTEMEVFSSKSQGFWPGEGCGMIVLMRESYAKQFGYKIYATVKGWGISSDGMGGITRPKSESQGLAMKRAYAMAGYGTDDVSLFEAHGTGTLVGDEIELKAIIDQLKEDKVTRPAILGSIKQLIGHTKAAAGIAGLIKTALTLDKKIIPPSKKYDNLHPLLEENLNILKVENQPLSWPEDKCLRAGISSFGFGGINVHLTIEESAEKNIELIAPLRENIVNVQQRISDELFCFTSNNIVALKDMLADYKTKIAQLSRSEFIDLSASLIKDLPNSSRCKLAVVSNSPENLSQKIENALSLIKDADTSFINVKQQIYFNSSTSKFKAAFLFPGQGTPLRADIGVFKQYIKQKDFSPEITTILNDNDTTTQHAVVRQNLESVQLLDSFGIKSEIGLGHSLGEISCLSWVGMLSSDNAIELAYKRGIAMANCAEAKGKMLAVRADYETVVRCITLYGVYLSGYNGPENFVLGGDEQSIDEAHYYLNSIEIPSSYVKVNFAFHTPLMNRSAELFRSDIKNLCFLQANKKMISTVTVEAISETTEVEPYLVDHINSPVRFYESFLEAEKEVNFFVEVGAGKTLSNALKDAHLNIVSLDYGADSISGLLNILAVAFAGNMNPNLQKLFYNRFAKPFNLEKWKLNVLINPCELLREKGSHPQFPLGETPLANDSYGKSQDNVMSEKHISIGPDLEVKAFIKNLISIKSEIPIDAILDEDRILSDLHINSLAISEIISLAVKFFDKDQATYAKASMVANENRTLNELSKCIIDGQSSKYSSSISSLDLERLPNWTQVFQRVNVEKKLMEASVSRSAGEVIFSGPTSKCSLLRTLLHEQNVSLGTGSIFLTDKNSDDECLKSFIEFIQSEKVLSGEFITLVQLDSKCRKYDLKPILRSFKQEYPFISIMTIDIEDNFEDALPIIINEIKFRTKYKEVKYLNHIRYESEIDALFLKSGDSKTLNEDDVMIVPGGGKGITFESVKFLAVTYHVKFAIIGRSNPENDPELSANLIFLSQNKINFKYYSADVLDHLAMHDCVRDAEIYLGAITSILYGAGINQPKLIKNINIRDFERTAAIKATGFRNLINAIKQDQLKLILGYGSIIAESGMEGNADYAWANDQLAGEICSFSQSYPNCKSVTIQWSIWSETGMGINLNSIDHLKSKGIWPIPIANGLKILDDFINDDSVKNGRYIVSGRYGDLPTLNFKREKLNIGRFIGEVVHYLPQLELVSNVKINLSSDPYLRNHVIDGQYIFPTVMILEAMAQIGGCLIKDSSGWSFKNLRISKPIFIPENGSLTLRILASRITKEQILVSIQSEDSDFEIENFQAVLCHGMKASLNSLPFQLPAGNVVNFNVEDKFYNDLLFHTGPFRKVSNFLYIDSYESLSEILVTERKSWFSNALSQNLVLGDAGINDAIIHCHQACRPSQRLLPTAVDSIFFTQNKVTSKLYVYTKELFEDGNNTTIDAYLLNENHEIIQYWEKLVLSQVKGHKFTKIWDLNLMIADLEYRFREDPDKCLLKLADIGIKEALMEMGQKDQLEINTDNGKLSFLANEEVSLSAQSKEYTVAIDGRVVQLIFASNMDKTTTSVQPI